ncbi:hypothetical protein DNTS_003161 [Danionella cerebrum]|uniref:Progonadoliberin n=1 Tax=Danionella cerebrum TaxID=2873325 RepID=A0A553N5W6_9TELE|nr:hypothetical protein DNTS_003161 [Danionella translucida]
MVLGFRLLLVAGLLLSLAGAQHWSHGWYPGGKRDTDTEPHQASEVSEDFKLCEAGKCTYMRPQGGNILKTILLDALIRDFQKRK